MSGVASDSIELQGNTAHDEDDGPLAPTSHSSIYDTKYSKSLRHYLTREALPHESNYRNLESIVVDNSNRPRPTLEELHESTIPAVSVNFILKVNNKFGCSDLNFCRELI